MSLEGNLLIKQIKKIFLSSNLVFSFPENSNLQQINNVYNSYMSYDKSDYDIIEKINRLELNYFDLFNIQDNNSCF